MKKLLTTTALAAVVLTASPVLAASDSELAEIKSQMMKMMERIEALEDENQSLRSAVSSESASLNNAELAPILSEGSVASIEPAAGDSDLEIGKTKIKLGGYAKADFIYDTNGFGGDFVHYNNMPLDGDAADGRSGDFHAHARQTRLNVSSVTPTSIGDVKAFVEVDFYGSERGSDLVTNNHQPELRQAYGEVGGLLAGQAWTNFVDLAAWPDSLDFRGVAGTTVMRQTQLRYSDSFNDNLSYSVSLENPLSDIRSAGGNTVSAFERYPDLVGSLTHKDDWGHVSLRGVLREISIDDQTLNREEHDVGYGLALSSKINVGEKDNFKFRIAHGDGIGRYLYDSATNSQGASYDSNGNLETQEATAAYAAYQHHWTDSLRSNIMGGYVDFDNNTNVLGTTTYNDKIWSGNVNLIWSPTPRYQAGLEYIHAERELDSGTEGDLDRVQMSFIYKFN